MLVLLLSGDIELKPGANDPDMTELLKGEKELLEMMGKIGKKLDGYIARTNQRLDSIECELKRLAGSGVQIEHREKAVDQISTSMVERQAKLDNLENSRRNNLIIYGLRESTSDTTESLRKIVLEDVFNSKIGVTLTSVERIHRIGKKKRDKNRPVILRRYNYQEKAEIIRNAHKLKYSGYSLSDDDSQQVREKESTHGNMQKQKKRMTTL